MATTTETETPIPPASAPQLTVLTRVASIPLISDSLAAVHSTLATNAYTKTPYEAAQALGSRAYKVSEPIQARLAPVIVRADGYANKAVDVVESKYPYPFHAPTEEIYGTLRQHSEHAYGAANKTIDDRVKAPAFGIAQGIDQSFTPVVDRFETVLKSINGKNDSDEASPDTPAEKAKDEYQYQRAYRLSIDLRDHLYSFTSEQVKQIQEHNILVQRATATAQNISNTLSTSYSVAAARVQALSDLMLTELHSIQASAAALPANAQASLHGLSERVGPVIAEVKLVFLSDASIADKLSQLRTTIEQQVQPLLEGATARIKAVRGQTEVTSNGTVSVNGNGAAH